LATLTVISPQATMRVESSFIPKSPKKNGQQ
jgi:hypothetical protein